MSVDFASFIGVFARPVAWALLHSLWQGGLAAAATVILLALIPVDQPRFRYAVCCTALVLLLLATCATAVYYHNPEVTIPQPTASRDTVSGAQVSPGPEQVSGAVGLRGQDAVPAVPFAVPRTLPHWVMGLWLLGVGILSLYHTIGWRRARCLARRGVQKMPEALTVRACRLCTKLGITRRVRLFQSTRACTPCVVGWLRPIILMPASVVTNLSIQQLEMITAHELAHIRRYDVLVNYLQIAVETVLFFNPAIWWISRQVRREREHCCDDLATAACGDRLRYAGALARLERLRAATPSTALAADGTPLLDRIQRLVGMPGQKRNQAGAGLAGVLVVALCITFGIGCLGDFATENAIAETKIITPSQYTPENDDLKGRWEVESGRHRPTLRLDFKSLGSDCSFTIDPAELPSATIGAEDGFQVVFDAGTFYCAGRLENENENVHGSGRCYFRANPQYREEMEELGFRIESTERAFELAIHDVTLAFTRGLRDAGYSGFSLDKLIELNIHDVTPEYINELDKLGYHGLSLDRLVEMQIHDVEPEYVRGLAELGYTDITASRLVEMSIHDVDLDYIRGLTRLGYTDISPAKLVEMRIHDVGPYFIEGLARLGYADLSPDRLVEMHIHDIDPDYIRGLQKLGYIDIKPAKLVEMRIHDVTPAFIERLRDRGYDNLSPSDLIELKIHGTTDREW